MEDFENFTIVTKVKHEDPFLLFRPEEFENENDKWVDDDQPTYQPQNELFVAKVGDDQHFMRRLKINVLNPDNVSK